MRRLRWLLVVVLLCWSWPASAAIALVNFDSGSGTGSASTVATLGKVTTTGNLLIAGICWNATTGTVSNVTDTALDAWVQAGAAAALVHGTADTCDIWYAKSITGNATNIVTANLSGAQTFRSIQVLQYSGASTTAPYETAASGTGAGGGGATTTSGSFSPAVSGNVNVAFASDNGSATWVAGTGYGVEITTVGPDRVAEDRTSAPSGAQTAAVVNNGTGSASIITVASFKPPSASTCSGRMLLGVGC